MTFRVLVTGSRTWPEPETIGNVLDALLAEHADMRVVHGGALGADAIAHLWALRRKVPTEVFPADWRAHGRSAGHVRNVQMIDTRPDLVLAFVHNGSPGTVGCANVAERKGIEVRRWIIWDDESPWSAARITPRP